MKTFFCIRWSLNPSCDVVLVSIQSLLTCVVKLVHSSGLSLHKRPTPSLTILTSVVASLCNLPTNPLFGAEFLCRRFPRVRRRHFEPTGDRSRADLAWAWADGCRAAVLGFRNFLQRGKERRRQRRLSVRRRRRKRGRKCVATEPTNHSSAFTWSRHYTSQTSGVFQSVCWTSSLSGISVGAFALPLCSFIILFPLAVSSFCSSEVLVPLSTPEPRV